MRTRFLILIFCLAFVTGTAAAQITSQRFAAITVENASDLRIVKEAPAPPGIGEVRVSSQIALSPNAELAAFWTTIPGSSTETVGGLLIWELVSDDTNSYPFNDGDSVTVIGFLDNDRLAYILNSASYHVLRLSTGELELSTPLPDGAYGVNEGILHREAGIAAFPITNTEVCLLDVDNGRCRIVYTEPDVLSLYSLALSADGAYLAAGDGDGNVWLWETHTLDLVRIVTPPLKGDSTDLISAVAFSPDGQTLAIGYGSLALWDLPSGRKMAQEFTLLEGHTGNVTHLHFTQDGATLLSMSGAIENSDVSLRAWDTAARSQVFVYDGDEFGELGAMTVSEDERLIVTLSFDELMRIFAVPA